MDDKQSELWWWWCMRSRKPYAACRLAACSVLVQTYAAAKVLTAELQVAVANKFFASYFVCQCMLAGRPNPIQWSQIKCVTDFFLLNTFFFLLTFRLLPAVCRRRWYFCFKLPRFRWILVCSQWLLRIDCQLTNYGSSGCLEQYRLQSNPVTNHSVLVFSTLGHHFRCDRPCSFFSAGSPL